jgi:FkbM family methyltransferase
MPLACVALGMALAVPVTIATVRVSRDPESILYSLRLRLGGAPAPSPPAGELAYEARWLDPAYGPGGESSGPEQWIVRDFFRDKRNGVFVDVGAADYKLGSNTWYLETELGWSGIAIDAQDLYRPGWEQHRPRTRFLTFFVSDRSSERARLHLSQMDPNYASHVEAFTKRLDPLAQGTLEVPTITLNDVFQAQGLTDIDFLSIDIELAEPKALAGLDAQRYRPRLVCIEAYPQVRQDILNYFARNGYVLLGHYLRVDLENLWFTPLAGVAGVGSSRLP